jgi:thiamine-phosphate pyrophosphorylase
MLIVISDSDFKPNEAGIVNELFHAGLDLFHIRKYGINEESLGKLISQIHAENHSKLVLHHNHEWGKEIGLNRFHYSETDRKKWEKENWIGVKNELVYSTSVHSPEEYNELPSHFSYAFLSPVFDSISKAGYKAVKFDLSKCQNEKTKLIGLGGIETDNVRQVFEMGFDGAALLGAIWNSDDPVNIFCVCRDAMHRVPTKQ